MKKQSIILVVLILSLIVCFVGCSEKESPVEKFEVSFNSNSGEGDMDVIVMSEGELKLPKNLFDRENYTFKGWSYSQNGEVELEDEATIEVKENVVLYAVWERNQIEGEVFVSQVAGTQNIEIAWANASEEIGRIEVLVKHNETELIKKTISDSNVLSEGKEEIDLFWGTFDVTTDIYSKDGISQKTFSNKVDVVADEYNISFFNGTFPVSLYTLMMEDADGADISNKENHFVYLSRPKAYDWNNLPAFMESIPVTYPGEDWDAALNKTAKWVKELYQANSDAKFNLYFTDNSVYVLCMLFIENGIPVNNWSAIMFSDGTGSAHYITQGFGGEDGSSKFEEMSLAWNNYVSTPGKSFTEDLPYTTYSLPHYAPVVCINMQNVKYYTGRIRAGENVVSTEFTTQLITNLKSNGLKEYYLNNLLNALNETEKAQFKTLYHIDENTFSEAKEQGKKVMMILGTSWGGESATLADYMRMTIALYGNDYVYYYKPHPGYPTSACADRQIVFEELREEGYEFYELEAAVAAEFFLFFFEDIEMVGYSSTTFASATDTNGAGVWGQPETYNSDLLESYFNLADETVLETKYGVELIDGHKYYEIILKDEMTTSEYDGAIYDATNKTIQYVLSA